ncbi:extracellular solute-binding protein family 1 [Beutenbergia cavernae DSM 12333]|uniref:Extracellular solute-binding protein family 1 n=1 Tax=Beutenbergia cavernae (strain ATCC BAA-8 / DSM 12333 / CCUG 43141 / JCM 11478 / NBRC 16432 / NCIMB 13614 / HKI 0122) TaxID=471853 RepID=C5C583_BEUC1|nr:ABC transporter substrate-binding protein [Beutenbergia cavernae]ACQ82223.1 extracellular solute-binding protein family 1 [Beutenbergia cavernae DSM 12333]
MSRSISGTPLARRTVLGAGAASAAAFLAACSSGGNGGSSSGNGEGGELKLLLIGGSPELDTFVNETLLPEFADSSGYTVTLEKVDWGSAFQQVTTAAGTGTLADVLLIGGIWTAPLADRGALLALDDHVASWGDLDSFYPGMIEDGAFDGSQYALPLYSDTRTTLYRADLLEQAGADPSSLPRTWEEFRSLAEQIQAARVEGVTAAVDWGQDQSIGLQQTFAQLLLQAGGTYYDESGKAQFSSEPGVLALEYLTGFYRDGLADVNMQDQGTGPRALVAGQAAMTYTGTFTVRNAVDNAPEIVEQLVAGPPLIGPSGSPVTSAWINKLGIAASTDDPDGSWQLVEHMLSRANVEQLDALFGGLPARSDLTDAEYLTDTPPGFIEAAEHIVPQPAHPNMLQIAPEINTAMQDAIRNPDDVERVLADLDATIDEINGV